MNLLVVDEDVGIVQGADAVDDVERARDQQQRRCEYGPAGTSHVQLLMCGSPIVGFRCLTGGIDVVAERQRQLGRGGHGAYQTDVGATAISVPTISSTLAPAARAISTFDW